MSPLVVSALFLLVEKKGQDVNHDRDAAENHNALQEPDHSVFLIIIDKDQVVVIGELSEPLVRAEAIDCFIARASMALPLSPPHPKPAEHALITQSYIALQSVTIPFFFLGAREPLATDRCVFFSSHSNGLTCFRSAFLSTLHLVDLKNKDIYTSHETDPLVRQKQKTSSNLKRI